MSYRKHIASGWSTLLTAFPKWDVPADTVRLWTLLLEDVDQAAVNAAASEISRTSKFPPSLSEWREAALRISGESKHHRLTPAEAWDEMYRNRHKTPNSPKWTTEAVRRAAEAVRWNDPDWLAEQIPTIRAQFERYYLSIANKTDSIDMARDARETMERIQRSGFFDSPKQIGGGQ